MDRRAEVLAARFKYMFAAYAAAYSMASVICAPFGGGFLSALAGAFLGMYSDDTVGTYSGGVVAAAAVLLFALNCRDGKFSDSAHRRIKIFTVIMIFNYACTFVISSILDFPAGFALTLGMVIFASAVYLKSYELGELKKIKSLGRDEWLRRTKKPSSRYIIIEAASGLCLFLMGSLAPLTSYVAGPLLILTALTACVLYDESRDSPPRGDKNLS
jgi:energy-converting hydrogenase Eha subunit B